MKTVHEVSAITGVSVRALHHYDAIGLLRPTATTEAGYRLYDDEALARLQTILFFRELDFSLADIRAILDSSGYDAREALRRQQALLRLKRERLDRLIALAEQCEKGETDMDFGAFDRAEINAYKEEARRRWGDTDAWRAYEEKGAPDDAGAGLMALFARLGEQKTLPPDHPAVQEAVAAIQRYISEKYYPCTDEILSGLGEMYVADDRFRANIDAAGGEGTAAFARAAIRAYCGK